MVNWSTMKLALARQMGFLILTQKTDYSFRTVVVDYGDALKIGSFVLQHWTFQ
jgi:hypothetical protein